MHEAFAIASVSLLSLKYIVIYLIMTDITCVTVPQINNLGVDTTNALHGTQVQERALDEKVEEVNENGDREEKPRAEVGDEESVPDIKHVY